VPGVIGVAGGVATARGRIVGRCGVHVDTAGVVVNSHGVAADWAVGAGSVVLGAVTELAIIVVRLEGGAEIAKEVVDRGCPGQVGAAVRGIAVAGIACWTSKGRPGGVTGKAAHRFSTPGKVKAVAPLATAEIGFRLGLMTALPVGQMNSTGRGRLSVAIGTAANEQRQKKERGHEPRNCLLHLLFLLADQW